MVYIKYEEYLDKFCSNETFRKKTGDTHGLGLPLRIRFKIWLLKRKGYLVRVTVDYHHHSMHIGKKIRGGEGFGFVRIYKYKLNALISDGLEIEKGSIGE